MFIVSSSALVSIFCPFLSTRLQRSGLYSSSPRCILLLNVFVRFMSIYNFTQTNDWIQFCLIWMIFLSSAVVTLALSLSGGAWAAMTIRLAHRRRGLSSTRPTTSRMSRFAFLGCSPHLTRSAPTRNASPIRSSTRR